MPKPPIELENGLRFDALRMQSLRAVRDIMGDGAWLAAGFIRNLVWDKQHGHTNATPLDDLDVIYLDAANLGLAAETDWQIRLQQQLALPWQVRNQARMAQLHGHCPYLDCADAITRWPETATCYAVRLDDADRLHWLAPLGWAPLLALSVERNPRFTGGDAVWQARIQQKNWPQRWPQLHMPTGQN